MSSNGLHEYSFIKTDMPYSYRHFGDDAVSLRRICFIAYPRNLILDKISQPHAQDTLRIFES